MIDVKEACEYLTQNDDFLILLHGSPDGDTIGSGYALCRALQKIGKRAQIACTDKIPSRYDYMTKDMEIQAFEPKSIIAVDVADPKLLGRLKTEYADKVGLCIDHHGSNLLYADKTLLDSSASATCEIIYTMIDFLGIIPDKSIANCLYTGIATDTGCFKFSNTTAKTHIIASKLMETGIDIGEINRIMFDTKSRGRIEVERQALDKMEFHFDGRCALIVITKEMQEQASDDDLEGITTLPRQIEGVLVGITMRHRDADRFKISIRTHDPIDASAMCAKLGGGGHIRAAGCELKCSLEQAEKTILDIVAEALGVH